MFIFNILLIIPLALGLVFGNFTDAQSKGRDTVRKNDINRISSKLEEHFNEEGGYPDGKLSPSILRGIDPEALVDPDGNPIVYVGGFTTEKTRPIVKPTELAQYIYAAYDCENAGAQPAAGATCSKYILSTFLEADPTGQFDKDSFN